MWFKSVLTIVTDPSQAETAIAAAARMALHDDGHLDVLTLGVDRMQPGYSYIGPATMMTDMSLDRAEEDAKAADTAARTALNRADPALRWAMDSAVTQMGSLTTVVGDAARFADLVVQCLPYGPDQAQEAEAVVEAALFQGQAPVLIVPPGAFPALAEPQRILLAWDRSAEALRATKCALPLLRAAAMVDITVVDPPSRGNERSDPGGLLCQFLVRHGVKAQVTVLARNLPQVSDVLAQHAMDIGADMMVMGAYGHSRLREAVLGGATRSMLEHSRVPVLLAH